MEDQYQKEVMDELRQLQDDADQLEHKRDGYAERISELAEIEMDRLREEGL